MSRGFQARINRRQRRHEQRMLKDITKAMVALRLLPFRRRLVACWLILFGRVKAKGAN